MRKLVSILSASVLMLSLAMVSLMAAADEHVLSPHEAFVVMDALVPQDAVPLVVINEATAIDAIDFTEPVSPPEPLSLVGATACTTGSLDAGNCVDFVIVAADILGLISTGDGAGGIALANEVGWRDKVTTC